MLLWGHECTCRIEGQRQPITLPGNRVGHSVVRVRPGRASDFEPDPRFRARRSRSGCGLDQEMGHGVAFLRRLDALPRRGPIPVSVATRDHSSVATTCRTQGVLRGRGSRSQPHSRWCVRHPRSRALPVPQQRPVRGAVSSPAATRRGPRGLAGPGRSRCGRRRPLTG